MSRGFQAVLTAACFAFTTLTVSPVIGFGGPEAHAATTVKSSKSNTSDRMGGGGGKKAAGRTKVKSGKSNSSDRMGGGGGFGGVQLNPQPEPPGRAKAK